MSTIEEIQTAVRQLPADELSILRDWLAAYDAEEWDRQFEADAAAGRLDWLAEEARADLRAGRCDPR